MENLDLGQNSVSVPVKRVTFKKLVLKTVLGFLAGPIGFFIAINSPVENGNLAMLILYAGIIIGFGGIIIFWIGLIQMFRYKK